MATIVEKYDHPPSWAAQIVQLRRRIRGYIMLKGLAILCIIAAIGFWASFAVDWLWEPTVNMRIAMLVGFIPLAMWIVWRLSLSRLRVPLPDSSMALLLERSYPMLGERLLTMVQLAGGKEKVAGGTERDDTFDPRLLAQVGDELEPLFPLTNPQKVLDSRPLARSFLGAFFLVLTILLFYLAQTTEVQIWAARNLAFQDVRWPRATRIRIEGFVAGDDGIRLKKVARGGEVNVRVRADLEYELPQRVEIHFATDEGRDRRIGMTRLKGAIPGRDTDQEYEYVFKNIRASTPLAVVAHSNRLFSKADRIDDLRIDAVESPALVDIQLHYTYPAYLQMPTATGSVRLNEPIPQGTQVRIVGRSNKPLSSASFQQTGRDAEVVDKEIRIDAGDAEKIEVEIPAVAADTQLDFRLFDMDRIENVEPVRLVLRTLEDQLPEVKVGLEGVGKSITPLAMIPMRGIVSDDYGVAETRVAYAVDGGPETFLPVALSAQGELGDSGPYAFDIESLQLKPGQNLSVQLQARDFCDLREAPTYGEGSKYTLKIVTESQLRAELERREKILRRRMETILSEAQRMEDSLERMQSKSSESEEVDEPKVEGSGGRRNSIRMVRIESALESADRMRHETANIAIEFERILIELRNNRVAFLAELEQRIGGRIIDPLNGISTNAFPVLEESLRQVREKIAVVASFATPLSVARENLRLILRQMQGVLENMLKLQRFNEVLTDLRKIIDAQQRVSQQTLEERQRLEKQLKDQLKKDLLD